MATTIKLKHTVTPAARPGSLVKGEIALNIHDGKVFYADHNSQVQELQTGAGGSSTLAGLADVELSSHVDGSALVYNATTSKWVPRTIVGEKGADGKDGAPGATGPRGEAGQPGAVGDTGAPGKDGPAGPAGPAGPIGPIGPVGPEGKEGPAGKDGVDGKEGPAGKDGIDGKDGEQGETGKGFHIAKTYATVAELEADVAPTGIDSGEFAIITTVDAGDHDNGRLYLWNGTAYTFVIDMATAATVVQGEQGPAGPIGPVGPVGPEGKEGPAGKDGIDGKDGAAGKDGAVGPEGPEGKEGPAGKDGVDGERGPQGNPGPAGAPGADGKDGADGEDGAVGPTGPTLYEKAIEAGTFTGTEQEWVNTRIDAYLLTATLVLDCGTF